MLFIGSDSLHNVICKKCLLKTIFEVAFSNKSLLGIEDIIELIIKLRFLQSEPNLFEKPKGLNK